MIISEANTVRDANDVQMLLDGCRCYYKLIPEKDSIHASTEGRSSRYPGKLNVWLTTYLLPLNYYLVRQLMDHLFIQMSARLYCLY